ncbi:MAG TPA: DUF948 domain-containing protein [Bacilli bacterium]
MLEWSLAVAAFSFVVLAGFAIPAIFALKSAILELSETIGQIRTRTDEIAAETLRLLQTSNRIAANAEDKMAALDNAFAAARRLGDCARNAIQALEGFFALILGTQKPTVR